ncbi:hypothetical protein Tco_0046379 [Tanacetum coccineum]
MIANRISPDPDISCQNLGFSRTGLLPSGRLNLTDDEDPTDEDGETGMGDLTGVSVSLGDEISSEGKESQESNIGDSDNTGDGGKTAGRAIITSGGGISSLIIRIRGDDSRMRGRRHDYNIPIVNNIRLLGTSLDQVLAAIDDLEETVKVCVRMRGVPPFYTRKSPWRPRSLSTQVLDMWSSKEVTWTSYGVVAMRGSDKEVMEDGDRVLGICSSLVMPTLVLCVWRTVTFLKKPNESVGFTEIVDFLKGSSLRYALTHNPTIYDSLVKQFWQTATVRTLANAIQELVAFIDNKEYTITKAYVRSKLQLADATSITNFLDADIYVGLATLGGYAGDHVPLLPAMLAGTAPDQGEGSTIPAGSQPTPDLVPSTSQPQPSSPLRSLDRQDTKIPQSQGPTITLVPDEATTTRVGVDTEGATTTTTGLDAGLDSGNINESPLRSHDTPLHDVNTSGSVEDSLKLKELSLLVPKLELKIGSLEKELKETKQTFGNAILTLVDRVKSLEVALKRKSKKVILSESEDEETENQGRKIQDIDDDPLVSLVRDFVTPTKTRVSALGEAQEEDISPTTLEAAKTLSKAAS